MPDATAPLARPIGLDSFLDLTDVKPLPPKPNPDGTVTLTFPDDVELTPGRTNEETLALVVERMTTADDAEVAQRRAIRSALVALMEQDPMPTTTDADRLAWLTERATLQDALLLPLAALFGAAPE